MRIAVVGCSHGELDNIYASAQHADHEAKQKGQPGIDLLICCGDFQAMRSPPDLHAMACPPKFRRLGHFHHYYAERKRAPFLTIVIGGNHESSGYMWELFHGGWLAPDIYYLGAAGCVIVDGWLRLAGASGIYKSHDFKKGHFETVPYDDRTIRSVYHIRQFEVARLLQLRDRGAPIDIFLSHDWPLGIEQHGDTQALLREKPFFKQEVESNSLGSPPLLALLQALKPAHWFAAHLHVRFAALWKHDGARTQVVRRGHTSAGAKAAPAAAPPPVPVTNPDEIALEDDDDDDDGTGSDSLREDKDLPLQSEEKGCPNGCENHDQGPEANPEEITMSDDEPEEGDQVEQESSGATQPSTASATKFLALSKPGFGKDFMQIVDIPAPLGWNPPPATTNDPNSRPSLHFDPHWLSITRVLAPYLSLNQSTTSRPFPNPAQLSSQVDESLAWVRKNIGTQSDGMIEVSAVQTFARTAPSTDEMNHDGPPTWYTNPQTEALHTLLGLENTINPVPPALRAQLAADRAAALAEEKKRMLAMLDQQDEAEIDGRMDGVDEEPPV